MKNLKKNNLVMKKDVKLFVSKNLPKRVDHKRYFYLINSFLYLIRNKLVLKPSIEKVKHYELKIRIKPILENYYQKTGNFYFLKYTKDEIYHDLYNIINEHEI